MAHNTNTDAALTALALIDAQLDKNNESVTALLEPKQDGTEIVRYLLWLTENLLSRAYAGDPHEAVAQFRLAVLRGES